MSESIKSSLKRFILCYKKNIGGEFKIQPPIIITAMDEFIATSKLSTKFSIPNSFIHRGSEKEGIIYCNRVYNPRFEGEFKTEVYEETR